MARTLTLEKTYAQMQALIASNGLDTQTFYKITDRGDNGLLFRAASTNRLENEGIRYMLCPATYVIGIDAYGNDWIGVWDELKQATVTTGQLCIWNGSVWQAGSVLSGNSPAEDFNDIEGDTGWTIINKNSFANHEYVEMIFNISYDFENDWISKQWDRLGNIFGGEKTYVIEQFGLNVVDLVDWNCHTPGVIAFINNNCVGIFNISNVPTIANNNMLGRKIVNCARLQAIELNQINGNIALCFDIASINNNKNSGDIYECSSINPASPISIYKNTDNTGTISGVWDADVTDAVVDKTGTAE